jgi:GNAT superfamily N-acetyltransferase
MIRDCLATDFDAMLTVINDGAQAYKGVIPADRWRDPYMPAEELEAEISAGVSFRGWFDEAGDLAGVMGRQPVKDVILIRHAYVASSHQRSGIGSALIKDLLGRADRTVLIGTWAAAHWAVGFYQKNNFELVSDADKNRLLSSYWTIPARQIETSVVLRYLG